MDPEQAARQITQAVTALFFSAENQARFHGAAEQLGVSPPMLKALLELRPGDAVPMRDLAERWQCDASFVTVTCDGLEAQGLVRRRVAEHDRRVKMVELTSEGAEALDWATGQVFGPRAGFQALTKDEQLTLARLLRKLADAQAAHDEALLDSPGVRAMARRLQAQRTREFRGWRGGGRWGAGSAHRRGHGDGGDAGGGDVAGGGWKEHFEAQRREIFGLKEELARLSAELKAQARRPVDDARAAKADIKARARRPIDEAKAAKADIKAEVKAVRDEVVNHLKGGGRRR
ncbi:MAG TPA: MarR family winged helix-turn-helix transcriptional regulator [Acidimicrobiales bacterium]